VNIENIRENVNITTFFDYKSEVNKNTKIIICGIPLDISASFKSGCKFGPDILRIVSKTVESFSPYFKIDIADFPVADIGNMKLSFDSYSFLRDIEESVFKILINKYIPIFIGGEHTVTLPIINVFKKFFDDFVIIQFDAHLDLREEYQNDKYSHACVMRRIFDELNFKNIIQIGCRAYTKNELDYANSNTNFFFDIKENIGKILDIIKDKNVYLSIDVDYFDPAFIPEVGTPEPNGFAYSDFLFFLDEINKLQKQSKTKIIGSDVVELSPTGIIYNNSSVFVANLIRDLLIVLYNIY